MNWGMPQQHVMMPPHSVRNIIMPQLPIMVHAAMDYVQIVDDVRSIRGTEGTRSGWRALNALEEHAYDAALGVIARYFEGRQRHNDRPEVIEVVRAGP